MTPVLEDARGKNQRISDMLWWSKEAIPEDKAYEILCPHGKQNPEIEQYLREVKTRTRLITPFKGGRSIRKSSDVTPEVAQMLAYLRQECGISLGDLIDKAAHALYAKKHSQGVSK